MTWLQWHETSERDASAAHVAMRQGDKARALELFLSAAKSEARALDELDPNKSRTLGITVVSAVSLWHKAEQSDLAQKIAFQWLSSGQLPEFATAQLRQLLQAIWTADTMHVAGVSFLPGQVLVSVRGGQVIVGGAPLDLIVDKVQIVQALFYRTIEFLKGLPHRSRGAPSLDVQEACRPWLFQAPPGSYQFSVAIQEPQQRDFFKSPGPAPMQVAQHFLEILRASSEAPTEQLPQIVPAKEYQNTFLKLARNLAPTGKNFAEVEIKAVGDARGVVLAPNDRKTINQAIHSSSPRPKAPDGPEEELRGILRALHLDRDWLELLVDGHPLRVDGASDTVDDVIGPMVNRRVVARVRRRGKTHRFIDIELDE